MIDIILVPQGAEYQAVCRGIGRSTTPAIVPIPIGAAPLTRYLHGWQQAGHVMAGQRLLVMGLCGGLTSHHAIADIVLYRECINRECINRENLKPTEALAALPCNSIFTAQLQAKLAGNVPLVSALTSDRLVWSAQEKHQLAQCYGADVVDMEGFAVLETLRQMEVTVAMLRVVSDNARHNLPDLTSAIDANGALQPLPLAWGMVRQPIAAMRLIRGSLRGLKTLEMIAKRVSQ